MDAGAKTPAKTDSENAGIRRRRNTAAVVFLLAAAFFLYARTINHSFLAYDDKSYIVENAYVYNGLTNAGLRWAFVSTEYANWNPLAWLSHMLDSELYGLNPGGHHLTNNLFHAINTVLVFLVLMRLTGGFWPSLFAALCHAAHPMHVETAAWVAERKELSASLFFLLAVFQYTKYAAAANPRARRLPYAAALVFHALGLMSKSMVVTLPVVLLLLDAWPLGRVPWFWTKGPEGPPPVPWPRLLTEKAPFFILSLAAGVVAMGAQGSLGNVIALEDLPLGSRLSNALVSYVRYLGMLLWPHSLAVYYPMPMVNPGWMVPWSIIIHASLIGWGIRFRKNAPWLLMGYLWFLVMLAPVSGILQVGWKSMADRYTYLPYLGLFTALAWQGAALVQTWPRLRAPVAIAASAAVFAQAGATWNQLGYWKDGVTLLSRTVEVTDANMTAYYILGMEYMDRGRLDEAVLWLRRSVVTAPSFTYGHHGLARALELRGDRQGAMRHYLETLRLNPEFFPGRYTMALFLEEQGRTKEAEAYYRSALALKPYYSDAREGLARMLLRQKRYTDAGREFLAASKDPRCAAKLPEFAGLFVKEGRYPEAEVLYRQAIQMFKNPAQAHRDLARMLETTGRIEEAVEQYREAIRLAPGLFTLHGELGRVLGRLGRSAEAEREARLVPERTPEYAEARLNLGVALIRQGRIEEAEAEFRTATEAPLAPTAAFYNLALILALQGKHAQAVDLFQKALDKGDENPRGHYNMAFSLLALKKREEAVAHLEKALSLDPGYTQAAELLKKTLDTTTDRMENPGKQDSGQKR